ncbi:MAG: phosphatase PAP2 family protein [Chitinispirillaceae bacterium]|nr:phosphatase PAP2 family protein [Chitinispirillaceae bacterium]
MGEALSGFDSALFLLINGAHHPAADCFFRCVTWLGNGWVVAPLLAAIVAAKVPRKHIARVFICGAIGLTLGGMVNSQIKRQVNRPRPVAFFAPEHSRAAIAGKDSIAAAHAGDVRLLGPDYTSRSFPSGHTNTAFAAATFMALLFGGWWYMSFTVAVLVGYSRVYLGVHFPLDAAGGAFLGSGMMWIVFMLSGCGRKYRLTRESHAEQ